MDDSLFLPATINDHDKQRMFNKTFSAQENTIVINLFNLIC
jgi:hypothetical protein